MNDQAHEVADELGVLRQNRLLRNPEEVVRFDDAIKRLAKIGDDTIIGGLCRAFDDSTYDEEVMFGLVHAVERREKTGGLQETAKAIPTMLPHARYWAKILHYRMLNSPIVRRSYADVLADSDTTARQSIEGLLREIRDENPEQFAIAVDEVLSLARLGRPAAEGEHE